MGEQNLVTTISFKDKNTDELIHQLTLMSKSKIAECINRTLNELSEKFCLPTSDILIESI